MCVRCWNVKLNPNFIFHNSSFTLAFPFIIYDRCNLMENPTLQHKFKFQLHGHTVFMNILAYRKLTDFEIETCMNEYVRSLKNRKLKNDVEITWQTLFGATGSL